jgi:hypothetical protein
MIKSVYKNCIIERYSSDDFNKNLKFGWIEKYIN